MLLTLWVPGKWHLGEISWTHIFFAAPERIRTLRPASHSIGCCAADASPMCSTRLCGENMCIICTAGCDFERAGSV